MIKQLIQKITSNTDLTKEETEKLFDILMKGEATDAQIGAVLVGLKMKGETVDEITSAASVMKREAVKVPVLDRSRLVDTCGTGGDKVNTFNVSTITAFVAAGAGAKVAKHGNRSVSSKCGSADIMEALGVNIQMPPEKSAEAIEKIGLAFLFAPIYHPAMKNVIKQRREIGVRTIFNILGPLSNPADAKFQLMGVYDPNLIEPLTKVLSQLGVERAFVVHGMEGLDEISITSDTLIGELDGEEISIYKVKPEDFGLNRASLSDIQGGDLEYNLKVALSILEGKEYSPKTDFVALNAAFALKAAGIIENIKDGIELAKETIYSKKAFEVLQKLREFN